MAEEPKESYLKKSSARLLMLSWGFGILAAFLYASFKSAKVAEIPMWAAIMLVSIMGLKVGQFVIEKWADKKPPE